MKIFVLLPILGLGAPSSEHNNRVGEVYWNHYGGYELTGYATSSGYVYDTLNAAKQACEGIGHDCSGVTFEGNSRYTVRKNRVFGWKGGAWESWKKGVIWTDNFYPRVYWDAKDPTGITNMQIPASKGPVVHHTVTAHCYNKAACMTEMKSIQDYHINGNGWSDIGYNFLIGEDGGIYEGRGYDIQGAHTGNWNSMTYGISVIGNFMTGTPNKAALDAIEQLIDHMERNWYISQNCWGLWGHRDNMATACPGDMLYKELQGWKNWHKQC